MKKIVMIPGDGIGKEIVGVTKELLDILFAKHQVEVSWEEKLAGGAAIDAVGVPLPQDTIDACQGADAVLLGAVGGPKWDHMPGNLRPEKAILGLRAALGLYCNLRPIRTYNGLKKYAPLKEELIKDLDFVIVRELNGGIYFGERMEAKGVGPDEMAWDKEIYSRYEVERIVQVAMDVAAKRKGKITSVDKANVLASSRLWRKIVGEIASENQQFQFENLYVDNAAMQLVINPSQFDVMVTTNLFGDILSDEGAVLTGSIGLLPSASLGTGTYLYEPIHGSAPDIAGKGIANPLGTILSAAMMCRYSLGLDAIADEIEQAVDKTLDQGYRTRDIYSEGDKLCGTREMFEAVANNL